MISGGNRNPTNAELGTWGPDGNGEASSRHPHRRPRPSANATVPVCVRASPATTRQALEVLLDNALTHRAGEVRLSCRPVGPGVVVDVADQGPGISCGVEEVIFTRRFSTADGDGVGLALARTLVEAHGGQLKLVSRHPTRFQIALPVAEAHPGPIL